MRTAARTVADYIAKLPPTARKAVKRLRALIKGTAPGLTERISYGIPTFDLDGKRLLYIAGWKDHVSVYPVTPAMVRELKDALKPYRSGRGTLRFEPDAPLPVTLIRRIVRVRVAEVRG
jgi:uncharacterized protein YdhG (YjbR/CyaY superfamily)